jgi:hypothetical protein
MGLSILWIEGQGEGKARLKIRSSGVTVAPGTDRRGKSTADVELNILPTFSGKGKEGVVKVGGESSGADESPGNSNRGNLAGDGGQITARLLPLERK